MYVRNPKFGMEEALFSVRGWLDAVDVSNRDETLDEEGARMYALHRELISDSNGAILASRIIKGDDSNLSDIVRAVLSEEPRFPIMVLVAILSRLKPSSGSEETSEETRVSAVVRIAHIMPTVTANLCEKASSGDICEDALSYALTLLTFLPTQSGIPLVEVRRALRLAATSRWLKLVVTVWRYDDMVGHVPGADEANATHGLGCLVSVYLESIAHAEEQASEDVDDDGTRGLDALVKLGKWFIAFVCMRLFNADVSQEERARLVDVLWHCGGRNRNYAITEVYSKVNVLRAVCHSASKLPTLHDLEYTSLRDAQEIEQYTFSTAQQLYLHVRFISSALRISRTVQDSLLETSASRVWFLDAVRQCTEVCESLHQAACSNEMNEKSLSLQSSAAAISYILWCALAWTTRNEESMDSSDPRPAGDEASLPRADLIRVISALADALVDICPSGAQVNGDEPSERQS